MDRAVYERMEEIDATHWWFVARRQIVGALIRRQFGGRRDLRILEVGCGTGSNISMLREFGAVEAIEPDAPARAVAARRTGVPIQGGFLPDGVALADRTYDLIVLLDVLEHIPDDRAAITFLRDKLVPNGKLLVTVPAAPWLWSAHDEAHHHHRRYTGSALKSVLSGSGYRLRYQSHFNSALFPLIAAARAIGKLTRREGGDDAQPSPLVNRLLRGVFGAERWWIGRLRAPFGVSLAAVAEPA